MNATELQHRAALEGVDQLVAGAVIEDGGRVLVLHRPEFEATRGGGWELPSGTVGSGDELMTALHRGVREKTGLEVAEILGYLGEFDDTSGQGRRIRQHTWSVTVRAPVRVIEHQDFAWIARADERPVSREVRALIRQHQHQQLGELPDPWPFTGLVLHTPRLQLRPDEDAGARELALLGAQGVHPPDEMPMGSPWTDEPPDVRCRKSMQASWRRRAEFTPESWRLNLLIRNRGCVIGTQLLYADQFRTLREVGTGSWFGLAYQGRGFGSEARAAVLAFAFDHLGAVAARTTAWHDNAASLRISRKLGYREDGVEREVRRGEATTVQRLLLSREDFDTHRPDWTVAVEGLEPCLSFLGAD